MRPKVEFVAMSNLSIDPNGRRSSNAFLDEIIESIQKNGLMNPLKVQASQDDGKYIILDGRLRYEALRRLNHSTVMCIIEESK